MRRLVFGLALLIACLAAPAGAATKPKKARASTSTPGLPPATPRTLQDIHIEGEIPVPQVLFITARDQRRFTQFHHRRYLKSCVKVGEETIYPSRISVWTPPAVRKSQEPAP